LYIAENAKDILRERDGLKFVLNILISDTDTGVKEAAMFALGCAVESNGKCEETVLYYLIIPVGL